MTQTSIPPDPRIRFDYDKATCWLPGHGYDAQPVGNVYGGITLHSTEHGVGQTPAGVWAFLRDSPDVAAHYGVEPDGTIQRILDPLWRAWHAGTSVWQGHPNCNTWMIGIEIFHRAGEGAYPAAQLAALMGLCRLLMHDHPTISVPGIAAHRWIALPLGRKQDPTDWPDAALHRWIAALGRSLTTGDPPL